MIRIRRKRKNQHFLYVIVYLTVAVLFLSHSLAYAEDSSNAYRVNKEFFRDLNHDFVRVVESPMHWGSRDFLHLSVILGSSVLIYAFDKDISNWFQENKTSESESISHLTSAFGHGIFLSALIASMYVSGELSNRDDLRKTALLSLESWAISGVIVSALKFTIGRARPLEGEDSSCFHPFSFKSRFHSFPSGHASAAFAVASVIADQSEELFIDILTYGLATMVAMSRVHDSKHWATDVLVGSAIGYYVGKKVSALSRGRHARNARINVQFSPKMQAVSFSFCF